MEEDILHLGGPNRPYMTEFTQLCRRHYTGNSVQKGNDRQVAPVGGILGAAHPLLPPVPNDGSGARNHDHTGGHGGHLA